MLNLFACYDCYDCYDCFDVLISLLLCFYSVALCLRMQCTFCILYLGRSMTGWKERLQNTLELLVIGSVWQARDAVTCTSFSSSASRLAMRPRGATSTSNETSLVRLLSITIEVPRHHVMKR